MTFYRKVLVLVLLTISALVYSQESNEVEPVASSLDSDIKAAMQGYTEADFIKMQQHYKQDSEVIEMMKLRSMAGNENAGVFLEFLELPYDEATLTYGRDVVASVIYTYYESISLLSRFEELNHELDAANKARNSSTLRSELTTEQYAEHAQFIWEEMVPSSGQSSWVSGEMLRAVEKLKDEAQRNANVNFHDGCHPRLIRYLRNRLVDERLFDPDTISRISEDLDRLEREDQPYTDDDIYDRLSDRVVDWFLYFGGSVVHENDPELEC